MDPALLLFPLDAEPTVVTRQAVIWSGSPAPIVMPLDWADPRQRAVWSQNRRNLPLALRVETMLEADLATEAWDLIELETRGGAHPDGLPAVLSRWADIRLAAADRPTGNGDGLRLLGTDPDRRHRDLRQVRQALRETVLAFRSLPWPRWHGPLLVVCRDPEGTDAELPAAASRPALPCVIVERPPPPGDLRPVCARAICDLVLALSAPPEEGWPAWLRIGLQESIARRAVGDLPSPKRMLTARRRAGEAALAALWQDATPERELSVAVATMLLHTRRQQNLPSFLDALRNGLGTPAALKLAYELDVERLLSER